MTHLFGCKTIKKHFFSLLDDALHRLRGSNSRFLRFFAS